MNRERCTRNTRRNFLNFLLTFLCSVLCFLCTVPRVVSAQAGQQQRPQMAEEVFKDVQILKGIPVDEFMDTMGFFAASLSLNCTDCHSPESASSWAKYADDTPLKRTARRMMLMVATINKTNFAGARAVTCYTCHGGQQSPKVVPSLSVQYGAPTEDPNDVEIRGQGSVDPIFDKYIQALGGAQRLASVTSFAAKGTYSGYDTDHQKVAMEIFAKAPAQRATVVHGIGAGNGESVRTYDGRAAWLASPDKPVPLMALTGGNLEGARIDAILSFPAQIKQAFSQWRTGMATIDDRDVQVVQGTNAGQPPVKLYFDPESGLLVRLVRYSESPIGRVPTQIDYSDYREVSGVKMPFRWTVTWTDNKSFTELSEVQPNVTIDAAKFARPTPTPPKPAR